MATNNGTIGNLRIQLGLDSAQLDRDLKAAQGKMDSFSKKLSASAVGIGLAMAGAATAMGIAVKSSLDAADDMVKTASKVGVAVDELSRLKHAADLSGVTMEGLSTALRKLSQNLMATAESGSGEAARAFQRLGISAVDASGQVKSADDVLSEVADRFATMPDGVQKTATAIAIFGRAGTDLIPMLNGGADALAEMKAEADALGIVIDEDAARAAERFNDNISRLKKTGEGITTQLAAALAPALANISDMLVAAAKNTKLMDSVTRGLEGGFKVVVSGAVAAGGVLKFLSDTLRGLAQILMQIWNRDFRGALDTYQAMWVETYNTAKGTALAIRDVWTGVGEGAASSARVAVEQGVVPAAATATRTVRAAADDAAKAVEALQARLARVREGLTTP